MDPSRLGRNPILSSSSSCRPAAFRPSPAPGDEAGGPTLCEPALSSPPPSTTDQPAFPFGPSAVAMPTVDYSSLTPPTSYAKLSLATSAFPSPAPLLPFPQDDPTPAMLAPARGARGTSSAPSGAKLKTKAKRKRPTIGKPQTFIQKLFEALDDPALQKLMAWDEAGHEIHIFRPSELMASFDRTQLFKQTKWASFTRQLNIYRFKKTSAYDLGLQDGRKLATGKLVSVWEHETLNRDSTDDEIATVKRRVADGEIAVSTPVSSSVPSVLPAASTASEPAKDRSPSPVPVVLDRKWRKTTAVPIRTSVVPPSGWAPSQRYGQTPAVAFERDLGWPAASTSASALQPQYVSRMPPAWQQPAPHLPVRQHYPAPPPTASFVRRERHSEPYRPPVRLPAPTRTVNVSQAKRFGLSTTAACNDSPTADSLALPMLNPPPVKHPVPQRMLGFPLDNSFLPPPTTTAAEGASLWQARSQQPARGLTTPPPTTLAHSPSSSAAGDAPPASYFPLDDPSGWSTITEADLHAAFFVHLPEPPPPPPQRTHPSSAGSSAHAVEGASLPLPSGHAHPRSYLRSNNPGRSTRPLPPLPPLAGKQCHTASATDYEDEGDIVDGYDCQTTLAVGYGPAYACAMGTAYPLA